MSSGKMDVWSCIETICSRSRSARARFSSASESSTLRDGTRSTSFASGITGKSSPGARYEYERYPSYFFFVMSRSPVAVLDVRGIRLRERELLEPVEQPLEPLECRRVVRAVLTEVAAELPPRETHHAAVQLVHEVQRDHPRMDEVTAVLVVDARLEHGLLELRAERVHLVERCVVRELEDAARVA